jgi:UDP-glucose 4-epimerase
VKNNIDAVMHFAASALVEESTRDPLFYYANNVKNTITLLQAMKEAETDKIIFSSSAAVYGEPMETPIKEGHQKNPVNTYGRTKLMVEQVLADLNKDCGLKYASLRYFNAAGAHSSGKTGEWHMPESHLIPLILDAAIGKEETIKIFGTDYNTPDGTCIRDYIHVTDLVDAHIRAMESLESGEPGGVFNLGNGKGYSIREVIEAAREACGVDIPVEESARRPADPAVLIADAGRAREVLGWEPSIRDIGDIVSSAWKWHKSLNTRLK